MQKRRPKAFLERVKRCYSSKMRYRKEKFPSWTARSGQKEDFRLRTAATRKAEGKEILWNAGKTVQKFILIKQRRRQGKTGDNLLILLETRLDNAVYRLGFASSRKRSKTARRTRTLYG